MDHRRAEPRFQSSGSSAAGSAGDDRQYELLGRRDRHRRHKGWQAPIRSWVSGNDRLCGTHCGFGLIASTRAMDDSGYCPKNPPTGMCLTSTMIGSFQNAVFVTIVGIGDNLWPFVSSNRPSDHITISAKSPGT